MGAWLLLGLLASPYVDPDARFRLEPGEDFELAPRFGDTEGIRLIQDAPARRGGGPAVFELRVVADHLCQGAPVAPRWKGRGALRRARLGDHCLEVHIEGSARAQRRAAPAIRTMLASVRLPEGASAPEVEPAPRPHRLHGRWSDGARTLQLGADGRFVLGRVEGAWRADARRIALAGPGGAPILLDYTLDADALILRGDAVGGEARFHRTKKAGAPPGPEAPTVGPAELSGVWRTDGGELRLGRDGRFQFGSFSGQWTVEQGQLHLRAGPADELLYRVELDGARLRLSGADLDHPLVFVRARAGADIQPVRRRPRLE